MKKLLAGLVVYLSFGYAHALDIFFVHSYHHSYPWVQEYYSAFNTHLNSFSLEDYQMDTKRIPADQFQQKADQALALIGQKKPKVVVVSDDNALRLVGKPALAAGFNVVFLGINGNPRLILPITPQLAGVLERPLLKRSVAELTRIVPNLQKILVLMDEGPTSFAILNTSFGNKKQQRINNVDVNVKLLRHFNNWQQAIKQSKQKSYDLIIIANYAKLLDQNNLAVPLNTTSRWSSQHSPIPIFAFWRYSIGKDKAVGGLVLSGKDQGRSSAEIVNHFLEKQRFPSLAILTPKQGRYLFSKAQLQRWQLDLPPNIIKQVEWLE